MNLLKKQKLKEKKKSGHRGLIYMHLKKCVVIVCFFSWQIHGAEQEFFQTSETNPPAVSIDDLFSFDTERDPAFAQPVVASKTFTQTEILDEEVGRVSDILFKALQQREKNNSFLPDYDASESVIINKKSLLKAITSYVNTHKNNISEIYLGTFSQMNLDKICDIVAKKFLKKRVKLQFMVHDIFYRDIPVKSFFTCDAMNKDMLDREIVQKIMLDYLGARPEFLREFLLPIDIEPVSQQLAQALIADRREYCKKHPQNLSVHLAKKVRANRKNTQKN
jgi:hypothetical protein